MASISGFVLIFEEGIALPRAAREATGGKKAKYQWSQTLESLDAPGSLSFARVVHLELDPKRVYSSLFWLQLSFSDPADKKS